MNRVDECSNAATRAAYLKGRSARLEGKPRDQVPYKDHRTNRGAITWSRTFRKRWFDGWDHADAEFSETPGVVDWARIRTGLYRARMLRHDLQVDYWPGGPPNWRWIVARRGPTLGFEFSDSVAVGSALTLKDAKAQAETCAWRQPKT